MNRLFFELVFQYGCACSRCVCMTCPPGFKCLGEKWSTMFNQQSTFHSRLRDKETMLVTWRAHWFAVSEEPNHSLAAAPDWYWVGHLTCAAASSQLLRLSHDTVCELLFNLLGSDEMFPPSYKVSLSSVFHNCSVVASHDNLLGHIPSAQLVQHILVYYTIDGTLQTPSCCWKNSAVWMTLQKTTTLVLQNARPLFDVRTYLWLILKDLCLQREQKYLVLVWEQPEYCYFGFCLGFLPNKWWKSKIIPSSSFTVPTDFKTSTTDN